jgi:hypothetical protein
MRRVAAVTLLTVALSLRPVCAQTWLDPGSAECIERSVAQHLAMLDSLRAAVLDIYPRELLDSAAFEAALVEARARAIAEKDSSDSHFIVILNDLLVRFCPGEERIVRYVGTCREILPLEHRIEYLPHVRAWREEKRFGVLQTGHWVPCKMTALVDSALDSLRGTSGLLLDLTSEHPLTGEHPCLAWEDVVEILGRLRDEPAVLLSLRVRVRGTEQTRDSVIIVKPRGEWQYTKPLVALMDSGCTWTSAVLAHSLSGRPYTKVIGFPFPEVRGILPVRVTLPGGTVVNIPSAMWVDGEGRLYKRVLPDVKAGARASKDWQALHRQGLRMLKDLTAAYEKEELRRIEWLFDR